MIVYTLGYSMQKRSTQNVAFWSMYSPNTFGSLEGAESDRSLIKLPNRGADPEPLLKRGLPRPTCSLLNTDTLLRVPVPRKYFKVVHLSHSGGLSAFLRTSLRLKTYKHYISCQ